MYIKEVLKFISKISTPKTLPIIHEFNCLMIDGVVDSFTNYSKLLNDIYKLVQKSLKNG